MNVVIRAPGRVNLIGEHTDYNDGFVLPAAIAYETIVRASSRDDRSVRVHSAAFAGSETFDLDALESGPRSHWSDNIRGMLVELQRAGYALCGANLTIEGNLPIGAGLSSSASVAIAAGLALAEIAGIAIDRVQLAQIAQRAENEHTGTRCGIMDQFVCLFAREHTAMLLDTRTLAYEYVRFSSEATFIVVNTMVKHRLVAGEYNKRRAQCAQAVETLRGLFPDIRALRDVSLAQLEVAHGAFKTAREGELLYRRARHVVTENARVLEAADALHAGNYAAFGRAMHASHASLRDDYEVSCAELDIAAELAQSFPGVYGARMTGGGFGGCTVNLVEAHARDAFCEYITGAYKQKTGIDPEIYFGVGADGAGLYRSEHAHE